MCSILLGLQKPVQKVYKDIVTDPVGKSKSPQVLHQQSCISLSLVLLPWWTKQDIYNKNRKKKFLKKK